MLQELLVSKIEILRDDMENYEPVSTAVAHVDSKSSKVSL